MLVSQAGDRLQGDVSLESNALLLDTLAKESQDHKALTLPPPKRPAPALTTSVSSKKPIQNPPPTGRGKVKFKGKGHFSGQSAHRGKGRGARKGRNVPDVRTPACMKAPEVPPLTVRDRCRPLGHAHRTMGVQDPLCDAAATETSGTRDHIPQGVLKWSSLSQSVQELRNKGAIEPAPLSRAFTADCSLFARQQGSGGRSYDLSSLNVFPQCLHALPELHYGDTSVSLQGPSTGPVVNLPRPERRLLSHRVDPADRRCSVTTAPLGSSQYCHSGCQPV